MIIIHNLKRDVHAALLERLGCYIDKLDQENSEAPYVTVVLSEYTLLKQNGTMTTLDKAGCKASFNLWDYDHIEIR